MEFPPGPQASRRRPGRPRSDTVDPHRAGDVLDLLLAQILKGKGQPVAYVVVNRIGDEHPAGIGQGFDARGDVDAVAIEVVALDDHVAELMPMRNSMRLSAGTPVLRSGIACCTATAQRTASTRLGNSASTPSPVVLTILPWCSAIFGSTSSWRSALRRFLPRPPPSAANTPPRRRRGSRRGGGSVACVTQHQVATATPQRPAAVASALSLVCSGRPRRIASSRYVAS